MLAFGSVGGFAFVVAGSSNVLDACSDFNAGCCASVMEVSFAACAGAPVATVSGTPGSPPIVPGSFRPHPIKSKPANAIPLNTILMRLRYDAFYPRPSRRPPIERSSFHSLVHPRGRSKSSALGVLAKESLRDSFRRSGLFLLASVPRSSH